MSNALEPTTELQAVTIFRRFQEHDGCPECDSGPCATYTALTGAMKVAAQKGLTPYVVSMPDGVMRGAWDQATADGFVRRYGATIVKSPSMQANPYVFEHRETIADHSVQNAWLSEEPDGVWLNIRAQTGGGMRKVYRYPESDARWLYACLTDAMRPLLRDSE
jgi:hypothetical protein